MQTTSSSHAAHSLGYRIIWGVRTGIPFSSRLGSGLWSESTYDGSVGHISEATVRAYIESRKRRA